MSELTVEQRLEALEKEVHGISAALEIRLQRLWKHDIDAAYRGQVHDILNATKTQTESEVANHVNRANSEQDRKVAERLKQHDGRLAERIADAQKHLVTQVDAIVIQTLDDYKVVSSLDNRPIKAK